MQLINQLMQFIRRNRTIGQEISLGLGFVSAAPRCSSWNFVGFFLKGIGFQGFRAHPEHHKDSYYRDYISHDQIFSVNQGNNY